MEYAARLEEMRRLVELLQGLQRCLAAVAEGKTPLTREGKYLGDTVAEISAKLGGLAPERSAEQEALGIARGRWRHLASSPLIDGKDLDKIPADRLLPEIRHVVDETDEMILALARVTIPPRVNDWLAGSVPSYYLPFHEVFKDELTREEHRTSILKDLSYFPDAVDYGIVVPEQGLIYRHSGNALKSWRMVAILALGTAAVAWILLWGRLPLASELELWSGDVSFLFPQSPGGDKSLYLVPWLAILGGILVHAIVEVQKRSAGEGRPPLFSLVMFPRWIDALSGVIVYKLVLSLVGLLGLLAVLGDRSPAMAFLVGYSLDSFIGLFGARWGQDAEALAAKWKEKDRKP